MRPSRAPDATERTQEAASGRFTTRDALSWCLTRRGFFRAPSPAKHKQTTTGRTACGRRRGSTPHARLDSLCKCQRPEHDRRRANTDTDPAEWPDRLANEAVNRSQRNEPRGSGSDRGTASRGGSGGCSGAYGQEASILNLASAFSGRTSRRRSTDRPTDRREATHGDSTS